MVDISIVIPVYKCYDSLYLLFSRISESLKEIPLKYEVIFVYDGGPYKDWEVISEIAEKNSNVVGIELSRNFGQHKAITAGLSYSAGEWIVVMDCDLQDNPYDIKRLYEKATLEKVDIVYASRKFRNDTFFKKFFSKWFYKTLEYLSETKQDHTIGNFGIYNRKVIEAILSMGDKIRVLPLMVRWVGFKSTSIDVIHENRECGKTSYSIKKLIHLALEIILSFSDKLLRITVKIGLFISFVSILFTIFTIIRYINGSISQLGYTSIIISIWFFSGLIIAILGMVGLYVGKTFEQTKDRPIYIIRSIKNKEKDK
ncbi:MAG TPA: glycosyltransferase family 2 protein [Bacteroidales bacterium]|nr:glycosyltransferase family 2 protein [Bacteroidales bacterium]